MIEVVYKIFPIIFLTLIGFYLNKFQLVKESLILKLKKIILTLFLPLTLFRIFLNMNLKVEHLWIVISTMILFFSFYLVGDLIGIFRGKRSLMKPFFYTGFSFGSVGVPLFILFFGEENLELFSMLGLANELFVWFIYFPLFLFKFSGGKLSLSVVTDVIKSPMILSIITGITLNLFGIGDFFNNNSITSSILNLLKILSNINLPLILICIGYGIKLRRGIIGESIKLVLTRISISFTLGYIFKILVLEGIFKLSGVILDFSFFTIIVLPPLYSFPLFLASYGEKTEEELANNATILSTLISMGLFIIYGLITLF